MILLAESCPLDLEMLSESAVPPPQTLESLVPFGAVLLQVLVHPRYLSHPSLYQQALGFLVLFWAVFIFF